MLYRSELQHHSLQIPTECPCANSGTPDCITSFLSKESVESQRDFFHQEGLGTIVEPRCGSCKCGKCPIPGARFTHQEEGELHLIHGNLKHNRTCWETEYPFLHPREFLRGTKDAAQKALLSTERSLKKNGFGEEYDKCIQDMVDREVARKVPTEELENF